MKLLPLWSLACCGAAIVNAEPTKLWAVLDEQPDGHNPRNRRLESTKKHFIKVDWQATSQHFKDAKAKQSNEITFDLPEKGQVTCKLRQGSVMHPDLAAKYPEIASYSGPCSDGSRVFINALIDKVDSLSATFLTPDNQFVYVDNAERDSDVYVVYRYKDAHRGADAEKKDFSCSVKRYDEGRELLLSGGHGHDHEQPRVVETKRSPNLRSLQAGTTSKGYKFRIAMVTNPQYSQYHGNTIPSVLTAVTTMMTRVNGVYMREFGVFFELIPNNDQLICLSGQACANQLPNDSRLIDINGNFIQSRNIPTSAFDIGHSVSTASGGVAGYPTLCTNRKADGTTGVPQPEGDPFTIDYVSHELGHQLLGAHTFRDCGGDPSNIMREGAVEPGSGTSIMGYAGICGPTNVQQNSDPYFNANNLQMMRDLIEEQVATVQGCGSSIDSQKPRPKVALSSNTCKVPANSKIVLTGKTETNGFYSWERVDRGPSQYDNLNNPRYRSWKPTKSLARFLPSLGYTVNKITDQMVEIAPKTTTTMTFRFTARSLYDTDGLATTNDNALIGDFGYGDMQVNFDSSIQPLKVTPLTTLTPFETQTITWDVGGTATLSPKVKIFMAENKIPTVTANTFDYEEHEAIHEWKLIDTVDNSGSATFKVPQFVNNKQIEINVLIVGDNEGCTFYDIIPKVSLAAVAGDPTIGEGDGLGSQPPPPSGASSDGNGGGLPTVPIIIGAAGILVVGGVFVMKRRGNGAAPKGERGGPYPQAAVVAYNGFQGGPPPPPPPQGGYGGYPGGHYSGNPKYGY